MTSRRRALLLAALAAAACTDPLTPPGGEVAPPAEVQVTALGMRAIGLEWLAVNDPDVIAYEVQRRANFRGPFEPVGGDISQPLDPTGLVLFFDNDLEPDTYYGYRVVTLTRFDGRSVPSTVRAARTAPPPGILVTTRTQVTTPESADGDGYVVSLTAGENRMNEAIGLTDARRFHPLPSGTYGVELSGVAPQCVLNGEPMRPAEVTDVGVNTVDTVLYDVTCRDPSLGTIVAVVAATGDTLDPDGYDLSLTGILADESLPDEQRAVSRTARIRQPPGGVFAFEALGPGDYDVRLDDVADFCQGEGSADRSAQVTPLSLDTLRFAVTCTVTAPADTTKPFIWVNSWSSDSIGTGQRVTLDLSLDLRRSPTQTLGSVQSRLLFADTVVRFDSVRATGPLTSLTVNAGQPGQVVLSAFTLTNAPTGLVPLARLSFTVVGPGGTAARTRTLDLEVGAGDLETRIDSLVRVTEDTVFVRAAGAANQAPAAEAGGPYAGTAGVPVALSAAGSADPDGTIVSYAWSYGDGQSGSGPTVSHAYAQAGAYTATVTVTDDDGATDTDQATVTIGPAGNLPPVAQANGPYAGSVGAPIGFSASGSSDPDGAITSYNWTFGDGGTATGPSPQHAYAAAGTFTAILIVADEDGATNSDQATVTVTTGTGGTPLVWASAFGAMSPTDSIVALAITLDLTADIAETAGPEQVATWVVDSLKWNPAVLQYSSFNFGSGAGGSVNPTFAAQGKLSLTGALPVPGSGVVAIGTVRFRVVGNPGAGTTTVTRLGPIRAPASLGSFDYRPRTAVLEGSFTVP